MTQSKGIRPLCGKAARLGAEGCLPCFQLFPHAESFAEKREREKCHISTGGCPREVGDSPHALWRDQGGEIVCWMMPVMYFKQGFSLPPAASAVLGPWVHEEVGFWLRNESEDWTNWHQRRANHAPHKSRDVWPGVWAALPYR